MLLVVHLPVMFCADFRKLVATRVAMGEEQDQSKRS